MKHQARKQSGKISWWQRLLFPARLPGLFAEHRYAPMAGMQAAVPDVPRAQVQLHRKAEGRGRCLLCVIIDTDAATVLRTAVMQNSGVVFMRLQQIAHKPQLRVWLYLESWARQRTLTTIMAVLPRAEFRF